jgi:hypothetical protein
MTIRADQNDDTLLAAALYLKRDMKAVIVAAHWTLADITFRFDAGDIIICIFPHKVLQKVSKSDYPSVHSEMRYFVQGQGMRRF